MTRFALTLAALLVAQVATAQVATAQDYRNVTSGMLLGIYTTPAQGGMQVTSLIPGYSAQGRLFPGDVLVRVAVSEQEVYRVRSLQELESAKMAIGPNREAAVELWRPNVGLLYAWVEFTPIYGPAAAPQASYQPQPQPGYQLQPGYQPQPAYQPQPGYGSPSPAPAAAVRNFGAQFKMESEKSGARAMFQGSQGNGRQSNHGSHNGANQVRRQVQQVIQSQQDLSRLFGR
jgi:hypothetical protein